MGIKYSHVVTIDDASRILRIDRLFEDGRQILMTQTELPNLEMSGRDKAVREFTQMLGENLLLDTPTGRQLFGL